MLTAWGTGSFLKKASSDRGRELRTRQVVYMVQ